MDYHYGKHHQTYVSNLNQLLPGTEFEIRHAGPYTTMRPRPTPARRTHASPAQAAAPRLLDRLSSCSLKPSGEKR